MSRARLANIRARGVAGVRHATKGLSDRRLLRCVLRILAKTVLCSIATVTAGHRAHINTAYFCFSDDLELYFLSHPGSLHCRNLQESPSMGMAIFSSSQRWGGPDRGVQLLGTCRQARGSQEKKAEGLYGKRFAAYARWRASLGKDDAARDYRFYRFLPTRLKVLDERTFGAAVFVSADVRRG
ncbi:MAG: pyridoxamine 5'-phosphate oxidase family protein [Planctomycetes bacterium]|nr:pyridoxamine 5'-phosphate oxidase family protein [Planctomycetota bacterium]